MDVIIIYKQDGTLQSTPDIKARPIPHDEARLRKVGVQEILASDNVPGPVNFPGEPGLPTSQVNAIAISKADWHERKGRIVGEVGFRPWMGTQLPKLKLGHECIASVDSELRADMMSWGGTPVLIRELIGRKCRSHYHGQPMTDDFVPERVNLEHDKNGFIVNIWFG